MLSQKGTCCSRNTWLATCGADGSDPTLSECGGETNVMCAEQARLHCYVSKEGIDISSPESMHCVVAGGLTRWRSVLSCAASKRDVTTSTLTPAYSTAWMVQETVCGTSPRMNVQVSQAMGSATIICMRCTVTHKVGAKCFALKY